MRQYSPGEVMLTLIAIAVGFYFAFAGYVLARLWYYAGALGPQPKRYVILPQYIMERLQREAAERGDDIVTKRFTMVGDTHSIFPISPKTPGISTNRFRTDALVDFNMDASEVADENARKEFIEQKRISRMPAFVQDDCGDGSLFPEIPEINPSDYMKGPRVLSKYEQPPFKDEPLKNYMTMGIKKLDMREWLIVDSEYIKFHETRMKSLNGRRSDVLQVKEEAEEACEELMREVVRFLTEKYPDLFDVVTRGPGRKFVRNKIVGEELPMQRPWICHPLEMCARLAQEDFNILQKSEFTGQHRLIASATLFPAGWKLHERIGKSVTDLHGPVPLWRDVPEILNNSYFTRLSPTSCMQRSSFFIQIDPDERSLSRLLFIQNPQDFFHGRIGDLRPDCVIVRRERQTFRRLEESETVVFTVKTTVQRLTDIEPSELTKLAKEIRVWPKEIASYKGRDLWSPLVYGFCEGKPTAPEDVDLDSQIRGLTAISEDEEEDFVRRPVGEIPAIPVLRRLVKRGE